MYMKSLKFHWLFMVQFQYDFTYRLLMETNIDMTRQTHQGTALHEAALCGKINAVKFLINVSCMF